MEAAALFSSGNANFVNEEYEEAVKHYTCAVTLQDCAEHRAARAAAYMKIGKFSETLEDAAAALAFEAKCHTALHWRGIALFYMGDYQAAKSAFQESLRANPHAKAPRALWLRKCEAELSGSTLPLGGVVAEASKAKAPEAAAAAPVPERSAAAAAATAPLPASAPAPTPAAASTSAAAAPAPQSGLTTSGRKRIKQEWYQSDTTIFLTLFAKGVQQDTCKVGFKERELSVSFPAPGTTDEEYQLDLELFDAIEPSGCKVDVSKVKVELALAKKSPGASWRDLEKASVPMETAPAQPAYPTSNKAKRDWAQIDRDVDTELKDEKPGGDEALNTLFKQIYERADPETRRAMNKSFQTSGGTVLSTNWGEVGSADYEGKDRPSAPDGQEWAQK